MHITINQLNERAELAESDKRRPVPWFIQRCIEHSFYCMQIDIQRDVYAISKTASRKRKSGSGISLEACPGEIAVNLRLYRCREEEAPSADCNNPDRCQDYD